MATASFDEKVIVTDIKTVAKMKKDLDDPTPVVIKRTGFTYAKGRKNAIKWLKTHNTEYCVCCGDEIPEGRQTCPNCGE